MTPERIHVWSWAPNADSVLCDICTWAEGTEMCFRLMCRQDEAVSKLEGLIADLEKTYPAAEVSYHGSPPLEVYHQLFLQVAERSQAAEGGACETCAIQPMCAVGQAVSQAGPLAPQITHCPVRMATDE